MIGHRTDMGIHKLRKVLLDFFRSIKKKKLRLAQIKGGARGFAEIREDGS